MGADGKILDRCKWPLCPRCRKGKRLRHNHPYCPPCMTEYRKENRPDADKVHQYYHGISLEQYTDLLEKQGGGCAICGTTEPGGRHAAFHVDHDHECCPGKRQCGECVRGLLCNKCNMALGLFKDDLGLLKKALRYLRGS